MLTQKQKLCLRFNEIMLGQPKHFAFLFCWKNRKNFLVQGDLNQFFYFLVALLLTPNTITCTVWHAVLSWKLISQDANSVQLTFITVTSIGEIWLPCQFMRRKSGEKRKLTWEITSIFYVLGRSNCFYWVLTLKSHSKWSECLIPCNSIVRNCRENSLAQSVVGEGWPRHA